MESARKIIAIIFISGFMISILLILSFGMFDQIDHNKILAVTGGVNGLLGAGLALILNYYFSRDKGESKKTGDG